MRQLGRAVLAAFLACACGGPETGSDGGGRDGQAIGVDGGPVTVCSAPGDCDDGQHCNGTERCEPGAAGAGPDGCVAGTAPCAAGETCDEGEDSCVPDDCAEPDADNDGHDRIGCGAGDDCDDDDPNRYPGNFEVCDATGHDEDCNPATISGNPDVDGDGHVDDACWNVRPDGTENRGTDCDDTRNTVHPAAPESCNGVDDDCDGMIDEGVLGTFHFDGDGDGFGCIPGADGCPPVVNACVVPEGYVTMSGDCDDRPVLGAAIHPAAAEVCDGQDNDCDAQIDEDVSIACYPDDDGDGYSPGGDPLSNCGSCPSGTTARAPVDASDCDDSDAGVHPGATEVCGGIDDDCDGLVDEEAADLGTRENCAACGNTCQFACDTTDVRFCDYPVGVESRVYTTCVHTYRGRFFCWGNGEHGQLAPGAALPASSPRPVQIALHYPYSITHLSVGNSHVCASGTDTRCWGGNTSGQLGVGDLVSRFLPSPVPGGLAGFRLSIGEETSCAVAGIGSSGPGMLYCWGTHVPVRSGSGVWALERRLEPTEIGSLRDRVEVSVGWGSGCYRDSAGDVWCWGANYWGQVGVGFQSEVIAEPTKVLLPGSASQIGVGVGFACSLVEGTPYCWGEDGSGQLGDGLGSPESCGGAGCSTSPRAVAVANGVRLFVGRNRACVRTVAGETYCWGYSVSGSIPGHTGTIEAPVRVPELDRFDAITLGNFYGCGIDGTSDEVWCWGQNNHGATGNGAVSGGSGLMPVLPPL